LSNERQRPASSPRARTEILAGVTTFLTMSYIAVVNPALLSTEGTGLEFAPVMTATVLVAAISSILMGAVARLPYALAPGMGLNAFFTYTLILGEGMSGPEALGAVVISGVLFLALSVTAARAAIARSFPISLRRGVAGGIGLFLVFIGLRNGGVVVDHPETLVSAGPLGIEVALFAGGLVVMALLSHLRIAGALLVGIVGVTGVALILGRAAPPVQLTAAPDFSLLGAFELGGLWTPAILAPLLTLLLTDLFDSLSTLLGVSQAAGLLDERGEPRRLGPALFVDAVATTLSGVAGTSPATTYIESAAGIREGGRTGWTAIVAGLCFVPLLFLAPMAAAVPVYATAPALVMVGLFMIGVLRELELDDALDALPVLLTLTLIPLTFSITQGIVWGVLAHLMVQVLKGRARSVPAALWVVGMCCALVLVVS
jgi:AGZA family xanthine/uracil permease-like MFS transporter